MTYKFLLFDLDHTLLDFDAAEDVALSHLLKEEGVKDIQAYKDYYVPMNKTLWKDLELKKITKQELVNTRFSRLFAHFGIEKDGAYLAERYQFFLSKQGQTFPGVEDLLKNLIHQGYELYAATNGITFIQTGRLEQSGISPYFKEIFISEQLHTQKPDAAFYEKIGARIPNFNKNHALMIGESLSAAKAFAWAHGLPLIPVNHMAGHLMAAQSVEPLEFPLLALLVSGGHTELVYVSEAGDYKIGAWRYRLA